MTFDIVQVWTIVVCLSLLLACTSHGNKKEMALAIGVLILPFGRVFGAW